MALYVSYALCPLSYTVLKFPVNFLQYFLLSAKLAGSTPKVHPFLTSLSAVSGWPVSCRGIQITRMSVKNRRPGVFPARFRLCQLENRLFTLKSYSLLEALPFLPKKKDIINRTPAITAAISKLSCTVASPALKLPTIFGANVLPSKPPVKIIPKMLP